MARKKRPLAPPARALLWLAVAAVSVFAIAEIYRFTRSESGQLALARHLGLGDRGRIAALMGRQIAAALDHAGIPRDSIRTGEWDGRSPVLWRVGLTGDASLLRTNYEVSRALEARGAAVLSGEETWSRSGAPVLALEVGLPRQATHVLRITRARPGAAAAEPATGRIALVLHGFSDAAWADSFFALPAPFAVAIAPGHPDSRALFRAARARGRETVLHLPLEPIDYPRVNPGPATLRVTMSPSEVSGAVRRHLGEAAPVSAVANQMGSLATQDMDLMRGVFHELRRKQVPFLHVAPVAGAVCRSLAGQMGVDYAEAGEVVDQEARRDEVQPLEARWREVLAGARGRGELIVWLRATPLTRRWLAGALAPRRLDGVSVVPLAALVRDD